MILLFITSIIVVAAIMFFGRRLNPKARIAISVAAFALINWPTIMALVVGDKPLPGSRTVTQEEMQGAAESQ